MEKTLTDNEKEAIRRCEYASQLLKEADIPHAIKKKEIGHINLFYMGKVVMSFWARTGKIYIARIPREDFDSSKYEDVRGIKNLIKIYQEEFRNGSKSII